MKKENICLAIIIFCVFLIVLGFLLNSRFKELEREIVECDKISIKYDECWNINKSSHSMGDLNADEFCFIYLKNNTIKDGDVIIDNRTRYENSTKLFIGHRTIPLTKNYYITKGDNNWIFDNYITRKKDIIGIIICKR